MYPSFPVMGHIDTAWSWSDLKARKIELLFLATPHEISRALVPEAIATECEWLT